MTIEALMEEIKPVLREKDAFYYRDESIILTPFSFYDYRVFDSKTELNDSSLKSFSQNVPLFVESLTKEMKPVVTDKNEYKYRDLSILIAFCGNFGLRILMQESK